MIKVEKGWNNKRKVIHIWVKKCGEFTKGELVSPNEELDSEILTQTVDTHDVVKK